MKFLIIFFVNCTLVSYILTGKMDPEIYSNGSIEIYAQDKYSADKRWEIFKLNFNKSYKSKISENFRLILKFFIYKF
jgi:hypothetical protein